MNVENGIITGEDSNSNWNDSEEEQEDYFGEKSLRVRHTWQRFLLAAACYLTDTPRSRMYN